MTISAEDAAKLFETVAGRVNNGFNNKFHQAHEIGQLIKLVEKTSVEELVQMKCALEPPSSHTPTLLHKSITDNLPGVLRTHARSQWQDGFYTISMAVDRAADEIEAWRATPSPAHPGARHAD